MLASVRHSRQPMIQTLRTRCAILAATLLASGCCAFGTYEQSYRYWDAPRLSEHQVRAVQRACDAQAVEDSRRRLDAHAAMAREQCALPEPFGEVSFVSRSGKPLDEDARERIMPRALALCDLLAEKGTLTAQEAAATCRGCGPSLPATTCYRERGLRQETGTRLACKPMSLF